MTPGRTVLIIAGEISGDMHAAGLVREIRSRMPDVRFLGTGGDAMRAEGVEILYHVRDMAVMGLSEVLLRMRFFRRVFRDLLATARRERPDAVVFVDYPGFNLRFAARTHALGLKNIYYICPQVWAWNRARIPRMARVIDRLITIFPFEPDEFRNTGLKADFVGHPLVDEADRVRTLPEPSLDWAGQPRIALLPGSRIHEIRRILPLMQTAADLIAARHPGASFRIAAPSPEMQQHVLAVLSDRAANGLLPASSVTAGQTRQVLQAADAAMVASGTATIEAALLHCPMIVVYRTAPLTFWFGKRLVRVPHIGMVNIVAGEQVCPELIQGEATPAALAGAIEPLLEDSPERSRMTLGLERVAAALGPPGAAARAAEIVVEELAAGGLTASPGHSAGPGTSA